MTPTNRPLSPALLACLAALGIGAIASTALSQTALYSNGHATPTNPGLSTGATSASGVAAPASSLWSEAASAGVGNSNAIAGFATQQTSSGGPFRFADDVAVPASITNPGGWLVSTISFYAYQPGAAANPFTAANVRIWSGRPGDAGSTVVFGDTTTNRMTASTATNMYRVFNSTATPGSVAPDTTRRIYRIDVSVRTPGAGGARLLLRPGTYWIDWQLDSNTANDDAFAPPVTTPGSRAPTGTNAGNARQYVASSLGGAWFDAIDPGKPSVAADVVQALPFLIDGAIHCAADMDDGSGAGTPDESVNIDDLIFMLRAFEEGALAADIDNGSGTGLGDQAVNIDDLVFFLRRFEEGC